MSKKILKNAVKVCAFLLIAILVASCASKGVGCPNNF